MYKILVAPNTPDYFDETKFRLVQIMNLETKGVFGEEPENPDYQEYLRWLAEGNTPEPADE